MIRIDLDTNIGINRNSSDWLGMVSYPILSPEKSIPRNRESEKVKLYFDK